MGWWYGSTTMFVSRRMRSVMAAKYESVESTSQ